MARHSIVDKLDQELRLPLLRESQVLYIMAEIRKLVEHEQESDQNAFDVLEFFCNWPLHIKIDRKCNAEKIHLFLRAFDFREGVSIQEHVASNFFKEIMHLARLRSELYNFFLKQALPHDLTANHRNWSAFLYLYTSIVSEVPMRYTKGDLLPDDVEELRIVRQTQTATVQKLVRWEVKLKKHKDPYYASVLYGQVRDQSGRLVGLEDFISTPGFQI